MIHTTPRRVFAVDPSIRACGWALFDDGRLTAAGLARTASAKVDQLEAVELVAGAARAAALGAPSELVIERPQVYDPRRRHDKKQKADPNDLITVAILIGAVIAVVPHSAVFTPLPREWKGQADKDVTEAQLRRAVLSPDEVRVVENCGAIKSLAHNVWDAVGIGAWRLGRYR